MVIGQTCTDILCPHKSFARIQFRAYKPEASLIQSLLKLLTPLGVPAFHPTRSRSINHFKLCAARARQAFEVTPVKFVEQATNLKIELEQGKEPLIAQPRQDPARDDLHADFCLWEAVRRLAVMECLPAGLLTPEETGAAISPQIRNLMWFQGFHQTPDLPDELIAGRERTYLKWLFDNFTVNKSAITERDINQYVRAYSQPKAMRSALEFYRTGAIDAKDNRQSLKRKLEMPVLVFGGDGSMNEAPLRAMQIAATNVRGEILKNTGHFVAKERPEYLAEQLLIFFSEHKYQTGEKK